MPNNKLPIIIAESGEYMETLRQYAGTAVVLPFGFDWTPVIEAEDTLQALINRPATECEVSHARRHNR